MVQTTATADSSSAGARSAPALVFSGVSFQYRNGDPAVLDGLDLAVAAGEVVALVGGNGSGKSTVARLANGLLQAKSGEVIVGGLDSGDPGSLWEVRARVGLLFQDPEDQIVGATVEDDVAFGLENRGVPRAEMRTRVRAALTSVGLLGQESTEPHLLSGGQKQRLALAGVLVLAPSVLVLDEPTSMLDPSGREEVMAAVRACADDGVAVLLITQHMEEALRADRLAALAGGRVVWEGRPRDFFHSGAYRSFPLDRPAAMALAEDLGVGDVEDPPLDEEELVEWLTLSPTGGDPQIPATVGVASPPRPSLPPAGPAGAEPAGPGEAAVRLRGVGYTYNAGTPFARAALDGVDLDVLRGSVTVLLGTTAAGKSTVLQLLAGLLAPERGTVESAGHGTKRRWGWRGPGEGGQEQRATVGMAFQRPEAQLFAATVYEDVGMAPRLQGLAEAAVDTRVRAALATVDLEADVFGPRSPFALSLGEQRRVALAGILSLDPGLLILDEPAAGLDPAARRRLVERLADRSERADRTLVLTSHDMEEVVRLADRVVVLSGGRIVAEGATSAVLGDPGLLRRAGLRAPLAARVAERLGCRSPGCPIDAVGLRRWLDERGDASVPGAAAPEGAG